MAARSPKSQKKCPWKRDLAGKRRCTSSQSLTKLLGRRIARLPLRCLEHFSKLSDSWKASTARLWQDFRYVKERGNLIRAMRTAVSSRSLGRSALRTQQGPTQCFASFGSPHFNLEDENLVPTMHGRGTPFPKMCATKNDLNAIRWS